MIDQIISQLVIGIVLGSIYSLMGIGLTLIWTISGIPDYSQAGIYMLSAYVALFAASQLNIPFFFVILFAMVIGAVMSILIEKSIYRTLRIRPSPPWMRTMLICAVGLSYMIENIGLFLFTATPRNMPSPYPMLVQVGPISLSVQRLLVFVTSVIFFAAIGIFIKWTWIGKAIRASAQNLEAAKLMGINVETVYSTIFALSGALTAVAACLVSPLYAIYPSMGSLPLTKCLVVAVLGGLGNIPGAIISGFIVGTVESLCTAFISADYRNGYAFFILIAVLLLRPEGIFKKKT
jgi:branched-chain amino acid transport system permease protein